MIHVHVARCLNRITSRSSLNRLGTSYRTRKTHLFERCSEKNNTPGCSPSLMTKVSDINVQCSASKTAAVKNVPRCQIILKRANFYDDNLINTE